LPDVWSSSTDSKYLSEFRQADLTALLVPDAAASSSKGPILMSVPLSLTKAEIVGTPLTIWEESSKFHSLLFETRLLSTG